MTPLTSQSLTRGALETNKIYYYMKLCIRIYYIIKVFYDTPKCRYFGDVSDHHWQSIPFSSSNHKKAFFPNFDLVRGMSNSLVFADRSLQRQTLCFHMAFHSEYRTGKCKYDSNLMNVSHLMNFVEQGRP